MSEDPKMSTPSKRKRIEVEEPPKIVESTPVDLKEQLRTLLNSAPAWNPNATAKFCGEFGDAYYTFLSQLKVLSS